MLKENYYGFKSRADKRLSNIIMQYATELYKKYKILKTLSIPINA